MSVFAQLSGTKRVECRNRQARCQLGAQNPADAFLHLIGRLVGEGDGQDVVGGNRINLHGIYQSIARFRYGPRLKCFQFLDKPLGNRAVDFTTLISIPVFDHIGYPPGNDRGLSCSGSG